MAKSIQQINFEKKVRDRILDMEANIESLLQDKSNGIYKALEELEKYSKSNRKTKPYDEEKMKKEMWTKISQEWSKSISKQLTTALSGDLTLLLSDIKFDYNEFSDLF